LKSSKLIEHPQGFQAFSIAFCQVLTLASLKHSDLVL